MQLLSKKNKITVKNMIDILVCFSVFAYIVSAISCEMVENTAFISTMAIYFVFAVGVAFVVLYNRIVVNEYVVLLVSLVLYVFIMTSAPNAAAMGRQIAYWLLTCSVLCVIVFWVSCRLDNIVSVAMVAYIVGTLILVTRIVGQYGGIVELLEYASMNGENRVGQLIGNENAIGLFFSTGILCSLVLFIKSKKIKAKLFLTVIMLVLGCMMLLTGSRKSVAFAVVGIILLVYFGYKKEQLGKRFSAFVGLFVTLAALYVLITTLPIFSTINERFQLLFEGVSLGTSSYETDQLRKMMVEKGLEAFWEKPIFGHGTGYSYVLFGTYSHNNFVELLMNYGLVGFSLYYGFYTVLLVRLFKQTMKNDLYAIFFFVYIFVQMVLGVGWVNYYERPVQIITALAFGYIVSKKIREKGI